MARRFSIVMLALLLCFQVAWGAAASYCAHESGSTSWHFGHHEHVHKADQGRSADFPFGVHDDCGTCHSLGALAVPAVGEQLAAIVVSQAPTRQPVSPHPSVPPRTPDRPQWARLA